MAQVTLETTNFEESQDENFTTIPQNDGDDDESFHVTASTTSSESSKPSVDMAIVSGSEGIASSTKREDVKLVKQLLDSESDETPTRSNLLKTAIKEEEKEEDESDFDFSAN